MIWKQLEKLCQEFKVEIDYFILAHIQFWKFKKSQEIMKKVMQDRFSVMFNIFETLTYVQGNTSSLVTTSNSQGLYEMIGILEEKFKSYAKATNIAYIFFM